MRKRFGLAVLLLFVGLAAPAAAQDSWDYYPPYVHTGYPRPRHKPRQPPSTMDQIKQFYAKLFDINTYLPPKGSTTNVIEDPRLLPQATASQAAKDLIDVIRPKNVPTITLP